MKKFVNYILVAAAMFAAFSCNKEAGFETPASNTLLFTATLDQPVKATLDAYKVCWQDGDVIAVYNGSTWANSSPITADDIEDGGLTATFAVSIAEASSYTLVYPASALSEAALPDGSPAGAIMLTLPIAQVIPAGGVVDPAALIQIGTSTTPNKVSFKNATSLVEFKVPESGIDAVFVQADDKGGSELKITGDGAVLPEPGFVTGGKPTVKISGSFTSGQNYFAVVWPQESVGTIRFGFSKGSGTSVQKAGRTGTSEAGFSLPVSGGKKFENIGSLKWLGKINTKADLDYWATIADFYSAGETVALGADINYEGGSWMPVSGNENSGHFAGTIDGAGHCIYNITLGCKSEYGGLFSIIASSEPRTRVKDLTLGKKDDGSSLVVNSAKVSYAGALASRIKNITLSNVKNYIPVTIENAASGSFFGGIVGQIMSGSENSVTNCHNYADVSFNSDIAGNDYYGGIVGLISGPAAISGCTNSGKVSRNVTSSSKGVNTFGGIAGRTGNTLSGVTITDCSNSGVIEASVNVKAGQIYFGGIIGMDGSTDVESERNIVISKCTNTGDINGFNQSTASYAAAGGIIGRISNNALVSECTNLGVVTKVGNHSIESCYGGIAGMVSGEAGLIEKCVNGKNGDATAGSVQDILQTSDKNQRYGGLIGFAMRGTCTNSINYGPVTSFESVSKTYVGGLTGNSTIGKFVSCSNYGIISVAGDSNTHSAGGLIGLQNGSSNDNATGEDCYVSASVTCGNAGNAGLVVGRFSNSVNSCWGTEAKPIKISNSCSVNGVAITASNYQTYIGGTNYGITASGVTVTGITDPADPTKTLGANTIWAVFE